MSIKRTIRKEQFRNDIIYYGQMILTKIFSMDNHLKI